MDIAQIEDLIKQLRDNAQQLNTTADLMEAMIQPWKTNQQMMEAWAKLWNGVMPAQPHNGKGFWKF